MDEPDGNIIVTEATERQAAQNKQTMEMDAKRWVQAIIMTSVAANPLTALTYVVWRLPSPGDS